MIYKSIDGKDGFGSHMQQYINGLMFAQLHGDTLYLSYDTDFEHNYTNDPTYKERMLTYINLHKYYGMPKDIDERSLPIVRNHYQFAEDNLDLILSSPEFALLKSRFFENKKNPYDSSFFNVAVHIRRPNPHDNRINGTDTADDIYLSIIESIRSKHKDKCIKFHIYSQGKLEAFDIYKGDDVELYIDAPVETTYDGLIFSDILVLSRSSFSYSAALLTDATVYYLKFWHTPSKNWVICN